MDQDKAQDVAVYGHHGTSLEHVEHLWSVYVHEELTPEHVETIARLIKAILPSLIAGVKAL
jgi:hypothetical protein